MRALLLALLCAGCSAPAALLGAAPAPAEGGLLVAPFGGGGTWLLELPAFRWRRPEGAEPPTPALRAGRHELRRTGNFGAELWENDPPRPLLRLEPEAGTVLGIAEAGGRLFVSGSSLWVLEAGRMREVPLPLGLRLARRRGSCAGCGAGCLEILGVLFTPAGPHPGWNQVLDRAGR